MTATSFQTFSKQTIIHSFWSAIPVSRNSFPYVLFLHKMEDLPYLPSILHA
jgi:hypothetical protein